MWDTSEYCWVVICKNHKFHHQKNHLFGHRIPLGVTDAFTPRPALSGPLVIRCDECGAEHSYEPAEVMRYEEVFPDSASTVSIGLWMLSHWFQADSIWALRF